MSLVVPVASAEVAQLVDAARSLARGADGHDRGRAPVPAGAVDLDALSDADVVDLLSALEDAKAAAEAAQLRLARLLADRRDAEEAERRRAPRGQRRGRRALGTCAEIGLAVRCAPGRAERLLGVARALVEMPCAAEALAQGRLTGWRAQLLVSATAGTELEIRQRVDRELCASPATLDGVGDRRLAGRARAIVAALDPAGVARRRAKAESERRVTSRPLPDTMVGIHAVLPVAQGVAVIAALGRAADQARAAGDPRGRGQVMADELVARVTGQARSGAVPVAVQLVVRAESLLPAAGTAGQHAPGWLLGHGPVDALTARDLVRSAAADPAARAASWVRRLFTAPGSEQLAAAEARTRRLPEGLADLVLARDAGLCRTPWCDAPARHLDHVVDHADGGPGDERNLQGLCEACNHAKQAPGWTHAPPDAHAAHRGSSHAVEVTTPTGHRHRGAAPPLPGPRLDLVDRLAIALELHLVA